MRKSKLSIVLALLLVTGISADSAFAGNKNKNKNKKKKDKDCTEELLGGAVFGGILGAIVGGGASDNPGLGAAVGAGAGVLVGAALCNSSESIDFAARADINKKGRKFKYRNSDRDYGYHNVAGVGRYRHWDNREYNDCRRIETYSCQTYRDRRGRPYETCDLKQVQVYCNQTGWVRDYNRNGFHDYNDDYGYGYGNGSYGRNDRDYGRNPGGRGRY